MTVYLVTRTDSYTLAIFKEKEKAEQFRDKKQKIYNDNYLIIKMQVE